jgi:alpha-tubulin suppressor-like RCC1 family protein
VSLGATALAVAVSDHACALISGGNIRCWGDNLGGELGLGDRVQRSNTMVPSAYGTVLLPAGKTATSIFTGSGYSCTQLSDGTAECWGDNSAGQIGIGNTATIGDNESPATSGIVMTPAAGVSSIIGGGGLTTCSLYAGGGGWHCWGDNTKGQLGYPDLTNRGNTPQTLPSSSTAVPAIGFGTGRSANAMYLGSAHTCAILDDNEIRCWGWNNNGQLGFGFTSAAPNDFVGGSSTTTPNNATATVQIHQ